MFNSVFGSYLLKLAPRNNLVSLTIIHPIICSSKKSKRRISRSGIEWVTRGKVVMENEFGCYRIERIYDVERSHESRR